jgi:hypothetical protein
MNSQPLTFSQSPPPTPNSQWRTQIDPFAAQRFPGNLPLEEPIKKQGEYPHSLHWNWEINKGESQPHPNPRQIHEYLLQVQRWYALVSEGSLITAALAEVPALYLLLKEAVEPLRLAFGERKLLQLEALESDDGGILRVVVKLPSDTETPAALMRGFKQGWWFKNCSRAEGSLVFDYETGNGF